MACSTLQRAFDDENVLSDMVGKLTEHHTINRSLYKNPKRFSSGNLPTKQATRKPVGNQGGRMRTANDVMIVSVLTEICTLKAPYK